MRDWLSGVTQPDFDLRDRGLGASCRCVSQAADISRLYKYISVNIFKPPFGQNIYMTHSVVSRPNRGSSPIKSNHNFRQYLAGLVAFQQDSMSSSKAIGVIVFDSFETLDVYSPIGLLVSD
jgi:hypothetical protein